MYVIPAALSVSARCARVLPVTQQANWRRLKMKIKVACKYTLVAKFIPMILCAAMAMPLDALAQGTAAANRTPKVHHVDAVTAAKAARRGAALSSAGTATSSRSRRESSNRRVGSKRDNLAGAE
jgi:hypothetical protein